MTVIDTGGKAMKKFTRQIIKIIIHCSFWTPILQGLFVSIIPASAYEKQDIKDIKISMDAEDVTIQETLEIIEGVPTVSTGGILDAGYMSNESGGYADLTDNWKNYQVSGSASNRFFDNALGVRRQLSAEEKALPTQQLDITFFNMYNQKDDHDAKYEKQY
jgi:hypothetical protein